MKCPNCSGVLSQSDLGDLGLVSAGRCSGCGGAWITKAELERHPGGEWSDLDSMSVQVSEALSDIICPVCVVSTTKVRFDGHTEIEVDRCPGCHGLWLDRGEVDAVHDAVLEYSETHGTLTEKPQTWSTMHWLVYRLAKHWRGSHMGEGIE